MSLEILFLPFLPSTSAFKFLCSWMSRIIFIYSIQTRWTKKIIIISTLFICLSSRKCFFFFILLACHFEWKIHSKAKSFPSCTPLLASLFEWLKINIMDEKMRDFFIILFSLINYSVCLKVLSWKKNTFDFFLWFLKIGRIFIWTKKFCSKKEDKIRL